MITIAKVPLPGAGSVWCLLSGRTSRVRLARLEPLRLPNSNATLFADPTARLILKAPPVRNRWIDNLAKLFLQTPADREARGSRQLARAGLNTPAVIARGVPLNPFSPYRSLLWCHYLEGTPTLSDYLKQNPDADNRQALLHSVAKQLRQLFDAGIAFRDFYFGNLLVTPNGEIHWIDTEIKSYPLRKTKAANRFLRKEQYMYERFLRHGGHAGEWQDFMSILFPQRKTSEPVR